MEKEKIILMLDRNEKNKLLNFLIRISQHYSFLESTCNNEDILRFSKEDKEFIKRIFKDIDLKIFKIIEDELNKPFRF